MKRPSRTSTDRYLLPLLLLGLMIGIHFLQWLISLPVLIPRRIDALPGILTSPFMHANPAHLAANAVPFLVLSYLTLGVVGRRYLSVLACIALVGGALLWLVGRNGAHLGASLLIYGLFTFLVANAWYRRSAMNLLVAVVVILLYSGLVWGILPLQDGVSFEGHLCGGCAGWLYARAGRGRGA